MATVDLIFDAECPNVSAARANLSLAFARAGMKPEWNEYRIGDQRTPAHTRGYGSPTILVDGRDVAGLPPSTETCCRIYEGVSGAAHAPAEEQIAAALASTRLAAKSSGSDSSWRTSLATVPGIGIALLPNIACPACWPAYAGILSSVGLGVLLDVRWLLPLTAVFLLVALVALGFRARRRRGLGPFFVGLAASVVVLIGKFKLGSDAAMYSGLGLLVLASIWNTWPRRRWRPFGLASPSNRQMRDGT